MATEKKPNKILLNEDDTRAKLLEGAKAVYDAVATSYGPRGRNFLLEKGFGRPMLSRDGVTIARDVFFEDRAKNMGAQLLIEASEVTNRIAGDGTSATVVLSGNLFKHAAQSVAAGVHPMVIKDVLIDDSQKMLDCLDELAIPVKDEQLKEVATVSSGDPLLGQLIAEAILHVGQDGGILTEKAPINEVERIYEDGYYLQSGFNALQAGKKEMVDPVVIVSNRRFTSAADVVELLTKATQASGIQPNTGNLLRTVLIGNFEEAAYFAVIELINRGAIDAIIIKTPPQFGEMGKFLLEDIAILAGCKVIGENTPMKAFDTSYLGTVKKVIASKTDSTLFADNDSEVVQDRIEEIQGQMEEEVSDGVIESLRDRIAKLEGKIAIFKIGGATDSIKEELEFRLEDAINATRAAYSDGIVAGGGITLLELSKLDVSDITKKALHDTFKQLLINANLPAELKLDEALKAKVGYGFNLRKDGKLVDMVKDGIIDPVLVTRETVKNAMNTIGAAITVGGSLIFADED